MSAQLLTKYVGTKIVEAARIISISRSDLNQVGVLLVEGADGQQRVTVTRAYLEKHSPQLGGYYVRYGDGYASFSPALAFESAYKPLSQATALENDAKLDALIEQAILTANLLPGSREVSLVKTKLQEARMWLSNVLDT